MKKGILYAFLTALCWSTSGLFVKFIHQSAFVIAGVTAAIALIVNRIVVKEKIHVSPLVICVGIAQFLMNLTFVFANQMTSVGNAIVLQYSSMIFVLVYESLDKHRFPYAYQIIVIIVALLGMTIFFFDSFSYTGMIGNLLAILSGAFFGLQFYMNAKKGSHPISSMQIQYIIAIFTMVVHMIFQDGVSFCVNDAVFLILGGIVQTALAGIFFSKCIIRIPAFTANVICMSEIIFAPLWAFLILKEGFTIYSMIGSCVMIAALLFNIVAEYQMKKI